MRGDLPCPIADPVQGPSNPFERHLRTAAFRDLCRGPHPARAIGRFEHAERELR